MSDQLCFVDSNVWLYILMVDPINKDNERRKRSLAIDLINNTNIVVSTQVINEVCSVLCRKASFTEEQIKRVIQSLYNRVSVIEVDYEILINASDLRTRYGLTYS
ncbi:MAG: PIN domain-containing protein [Nostocaceae cyanobacterium]|nr:PIN domain-containing protein [Nostocaceae cyanobacterium]